MRYPNPRDEYEVCCYGCSDYLPKRIAHSEGGEYGAWFCPFCLVANQQYDIDMGYTPKPLPLKARRFLASHIKSLQASLKIGA